jgi:hypothetical protein
VQEANNLKPSRASVTRSLEALVFLPSLENLS